MSYGATRTLCGRRKPLVSILWLGRPYPTLLPFLFPDRVTASLPAGVNASWVRASTGVVQGLTPIDPETLVFDPVTPSSFASGETAELSDLLGKCRFFVT